MLTQPSFPHLPYDLINLPEQHDIGKYPRIPNHHFSTRSFRLDREKKPKYRMQTRAGLHIIPRCLI